MHEPDGESLGYRGVTACNAAGISYRQLDYWARTGLVVPSVRDASGSGTQRLYSFRDLVVLKVVKRLLDAGVSLQNIRKAIETLRAHGVEDLAGITLISDGTTVYECRSPEEVVDLLQGGQGVFGIAIGGAFKEIKGSLSHLPAGREPAGGVGRRAADAEQSVPADRSWRPGGRAGAPVRQASVGHAGATGGWRAVALLVAVTARERPPGQPAGGAEGATPPRNLSGTQDRDRQAPLERRATEGEA